MKPTVFYIKNLLPITALLFVLGCNPAAKNSEIRTLSVLDIESIYDADKVKDFVFTLADDNTNTQKEVAKKEFLKGLDLKANEKNPAEAVHYFRKAASLYPDANTYYELATVLADLKQYTEASNALILAETLRFTPLANLYFKQAQLAALQDNNGYNNAYSVADYLRKSIEQGFADKALIEKEPAFADLQKTEPFLRLYLDNFTQLKDKEEAEFRMFLAGFPVQENGYELKTEQLEQNHDKYISYDFAKYVKEMETRQDFGRDVGSEYYYAAKVQETSAYVAVVYLAKDAVSETIPPTFASFVTYDLKGKEISKIPFACQCDYKTIKTGKIVGSEITVTQHNREWEAEFTSVSPSENKIKAITEVSKNTYTIAANGTITPSSNNVSMR
jgi:hypothetical protein